jgi:hypothetical protein
VDLTWLKKRVAVAEAEARHMVRRKALGPKPFPFGFSNSRWRAFLEGMRPGDELWEYCSPQEDWDNCMGSEGIALVRGGAVVDTHLCRMN